MLKATFRFYEELNDFLPKHRKKIDFQAEINGRKTIKEIIEAFGVPSTEVDLVLINGGSVDFNTIIKDGDRVSVFPVFESLNIQDVTMLRRFPLRRIRFITDHHLKEIVKPMRILGFDIDFNESYTTQDIIGKSMQEKRIILTKTKNLLKSESVTHAMLIQPGTETNKVKYIIDYLDIKDRIKPFSRCPVCNNQIDIQQRKHIMNRVSSKPKRIFERYLVCKSCNKQDRRVYISTQR